MKAKMATKEKRSIAIQDAFVNKLRSVHDLEKNRLVQREWVASDEMVLGLKLGWNLCLNVALVAQTVTNFFFERIKSEPLEWMTIVFKRIAQAIWKDHIFLSNG